MATSQTVRGQRRLRLKTAMFDPLPAGEAPPRPAVEAPPPPDAVPLLAFTAAFVLARYLTGRRRG